jgi:hypothetical protein
VSSARVAKFSGVGSANLDEFVTGGAVPGFRVLTMNVWFAERGWKERANALCDEIEAMRPDVVCLQVFGVLLAFPLKLTPPLPAFFSRRK